MIKELENKRFHLSYLRKKASNDPYGVLLAFLDNNVVRFGWSKCGIDKGGNLKDRFNKEKGQLIAFKRGESVGLKKVPSDFSSIMDNFISDSKSYFTPKVPKFEDTVSYVAEIPAQ